ncbi:hypothetical protein EVAR_21425_1 [Eumeta japonica]|uniref:Uncharacterized protein n=1 Tax=Eumeta variegata TaxID=151549 RepID=A0A4C1VGZ4_EUMVA|nr:hypothetical protein EVAR_21425_1 [Eumeta japonica]
MAAPCLEWSGGVTSDETEPRRRAPYCGIGRCESPSGESRRDAPPRAGVERVRTYSTSYVTKSDAAHEIVKAISAQEMVKVTVNAYRIRE